MSGASSRARSAAGNGTASARSSDPRFSAILQQLPSAQRYAPRPGALPVESKSIVPSGARTTRMRSRFCRSVRHATQVRVG
jgi:hypothetical protein